MFGNGIDIMLVTAQFLLFVAIVVIFYSLINLLSARSETVRRLKQKDKTGEGAEQENIGLSLDSDALKRFEKYLTPDNPERLNELRATLVRAGYKQRSAVRVYYAYRIALSIGAVLFSIIFLPLIMTETSLMITASAMFMIILIAYFVPSFWVERAYQYRKINIEKGFPDALDLLLVCIEAGNGFDQALNRVVRELKSTNKILTEELSVVTRELRAGKDRYDVLTSFAERAGVDSISSFITVIKQADKFGVSIADALRVYSREMRDKRYMKAEEKANMMPVKLALGAITFTVPPAILIMVGPSIIMIIRHLGDINS